MATLELKNVKKVYQDKHVAVQDINIDIKDGEFIVIVGPSGCGKSTLMRMVAGLEEISEGEILIDKQIVNKLEPAQRNIAMVFQNYALYPHMNVYDNMAYSLKIQKIPKYEIKERVMQAARMLGLEELLERKPKELSGGQRQRVAMGRAVVRRAKVFLFDEPLSNLDAKLRIQMRLEIQKMHREFKTSSLYVTHDQIEAMSLADRIVVLNKGRIEQIGTPEEIFQFPKTVFVAQFIGSPPMNIIDVSISNDGILTTNSDNEAEKIDVSYICPKKLFGSQAFLGIRPEYMVIDEKGIEAEIDSIEILGSEKLFHLKYARGYMVMRRSISDYPNAKTGDKIHVWQDIEHLETWFDAQTKYAVYKDHNIPFNEDKEEQL